MKKYTLLLILINPIIACSQNGRKKDFFIKHFVRKREPKKLPPVAEMIIFNDGFVPCKNIREFDMRCLHIKFFERLKKYEHLQ